MIRNLINPILFLLLGACAAGINDAGSNGGIALTEENSMELLQDASIAANEARVFYQHGTLPEKVNFYEKYCSLRLESPQKVAQKLVADTLEIIKYEMYRESGIGEYFQIRTKVFLQSRKNPDLLYMECVDHFDFLGKIRTILVSDVKEIFGAHLDVN